MADERDEPSAAVSGPTAPDASAVNAAWPAEPRPASGLRRLLERLLLRVLGPRFEAQRAWNARQVQLDNETLLYLQERFAATHRHYDALIADLGRHQQDADERHRLLEGELVRHVHELVERIDLVLAESSRGRLQAQFALEDVRARLERLEQALRGRSG